MSLPTKVRNAFANRAFAYRKKLARRLVIGSPRPEDPETFAASLNETQGLFVRWNAERLGISEAESLRRYAGSWHTVSGGHRGVGFEILMFLNQEIFSVFFGNDEKELFDTYRFHGHRDLLRQMIFPEPRFTPDHPVVAGLADRSEIDILDFGCGLAQRSRFLAAHLQRQGKRVRVHLADIPSVESEFLSWMGSNTDLDITFLPCTAANPIPDLPNCDVLVATEFFEHVTDPLAYFERFDRVLRPGGFLWTDVADHEEGFLHVCPQLGDLRATLAERNYASLETHVLYRKGAPAPGTA